MIDADDDEQDYADGVERIGQEIDGREIARITDRKGDRDYKPGRQ